MYKLRKATKEDLPLILEMGEQFYAESPYPAMDLPYNAESQRAHALDVLARGIIVLAEAEGQVVGMLGLILQPFHLNTDYLVSTEVAWWIHPDHRKTKLGGGMVEYARAYAHMKGATHRSMSVLSTSPEGIDGFLRSNGMLPVETGYIGAV